LIVISHRGNLDGRVIEKENEPNYLLQAIDHGFDIELDIHWWKEAFWLGHDKPEYEVNTSFLESIKERAWFHCKNLEVVEKFYNTKYNWFWHEEDKVTLTSNGNIWCYPGYEIQNGIAVEKDKKVNCDINILGVCTDYPLRYLM